MQQITNPHDKFFQETFTREEVARSFLENYLPEEIRKRVDFSTLSIVKDSFVDREFREHFSDILYTVRFSEAELLLYLLFEHKSYPEFMVAFQLLRYLVKIWEQYLKQRPNARKLPPVLPIVIYQGKTEWRIPDNFQNLIMIPEGMPAEFIPEFRYKIFDISHMPDEEIRGQITGRAVLMAMKHIFRKDLRQKLPGILSMLHRLGNRNTALEMLEILLRYVVQTTEKFGEREITEILNETVIGEDIMQTFIDKYIEQGLQQGLQQGLHRGLHQGLQQGEKRSLVRMLETRFGSLPQWAGKKIESADLSSVEKWSIRLLTSDTLENTLRN